MREPPGFRDYVQSRQAHLLRMAWLLTGDWYTAEDVLQTALVRVWPRWTKLADAGDPDAYVRRTVLNAFLSGRRRRWNAERPHADAGSELMEPSDPFASADLHDLLSRELLTLPAGQRAVLVLRYFEDLSETKTAEALGCSVGTVKSQTSKALARLRAQALGVVEEESS